MAVQSLGWGPGAGAGGRWGSENSERPPPPAHQPPGPVSFPRSEQLGGEAVTGISAPTPSSLPAPKGRSVHPSVLHPSYPQVGPPRPPGTGRAGAPWLEVRGQSGSREVESSWSSIQLRTGLGQGTEWVGQHPALWELLVDWRRYSPAQRGMRTGGHSRA